MVVMKNTKPIKQHISCGGLLFKQNREKVYLIYSHKNKGWKLPKGHVEAGETIAQTAKREIYEESGYPNIELTSDKPAVSIKYYFELDDDPSYFHHKNVHFFVADLINDERHEDTQDEDENLDGAWFDTSNIIDTLLFDNEKQVASEILSVSL